MKKLVSVVTPAYNEEDCIADLITRLGDVFDAESKYAWECIIVENGSTDNTWELVKQGCEIDPRFKAVRLARNFRMDGGLTAGLDFVTGDACVLMASDLQDPPEFIPHFLRAWEQGFSNVYAVITKRSGTGLIRRMNSRAFYWLARRLTGEKIPENASDFRLLDRRAYETLRMMDERNRFVRGLVGWMGFSALGIPMERPPRPGGESKAHTLGVLDLALRGIFAHTVLPLRMISLAGLMLSVASVVGLLISIVLWLTRGVPFSGFGTLTALILFGFGILIFFLGVISEYIGLIYEEVKARPNFIVRETLGC